MKIKVTLPYDGIPRGEYEHTDKALKGYARYLVTSGHASIIDGALSDLDVTAPSASTRAVIETDDDKPKRTRRKTNGNAS